MFGYEKLKNDVMQQGLILERTARRLERMEGQVIEISDNLDHLLAKFDTLINAIRNIEKCPEPPKAPGRPKKKNKE